MTEPSTDNNAMHTFPLTGPINLLVKLGHGSVTVNAVDDLDTARVQLATPHPNSKLLEQFTVEMRGPTLAVVGPRQGGIADMIGGWLRDRDGVLAEIDVPSGTALKINTASADIVVHGRSGGADVATGSAEIDLDTVDGDVRVRCGSSGVQIGTVVGDAVVRNGSGDLHIDQLRGGLHAGFGSGNLEVGSARGSVRSRTGSGDAHIGAAYGDVDLSSGSGRMSVGLPAGVSARLDVNSGSGRVESDLPIDDAPTSKAAITVRARTGSGDIRLFRASDAA
jgi:hypothetical protein